MGRLRNLAIVALWAAVFVAFSHADIVNGSQRAEIIAELGKPTSTARLGGREILQYKGARFELVNDAVVDIKGYVPAPAPVGALPKPTPAVIEGPKVEEAEPLDAQLSALSAGTEVNPAIAANALGDEVAKMNTAWGTLPPVPEKPAAGWLETAVIVLLHFGFTILALSIAFKYWEMDALWTGTLAIAAIDVVLYGLLIVLGPSTGGFTSMSGVQTSVPGVVMIFTVRHFCFNKNLQNALLTTAVVKLVVMICNLFFFIALLNSLFG
ncbi:MAG: hypothetical protein ABIZ81_14705 [Opitutaceae bacterium]